MPTTPAPRLLHITQPTDAGVAQCVLDYATAQRRQGQDVHVACPSDGWLPERLTTAGVPVHEWPAVRSPGPRSAIEALRLGRIITAVSPELVHLHAAKAGLAGRLAVRGRTPTVFQPHAWSFEAVGGPFRVASLVWERAAVRWTDVLVCVSQAEKDDGVAAGVRVPRTCVVPNGVDVRALQPADDDARRLARRGLGLDERAPLCVCIGRLAPQKGQDVLLAAWPQVLAKVPAARLALVGDGPAREELSRLSPRDVLFAGARSDVAAWLAAADVVAAPSRWEGMALVPLEAMARARSVVVSDAAGMREVVPAGAGAVVPTGAVSDLAAELAARLGGAVDPDAEGAVGRAFVQRRHDLTRTVAELERAYALALSPAEPPQGNRTG